MPEQLRMAAEVRTWLTELRSSDPAAARAVGAVTLALLIAGENLGPPTVRELGRAAALDDTHTALDRAYQRGLDIMRDVRRAAADASTARKRAEFQLGEAQALLARCQERSTSGSSSVDTFRTSKEVLKASYTAAATERLIDEALAALEEQAQAERGEAGAERTTRRVVASRPRQISAAI